MLHEFAEKLTFFSQIMGNGFKTLYVLSRTQTVFHTPKVGLEKVRKIVIFRFFPHPLIAIVQLFTSILFNATFSDINILLFLSNTYAGCVIYNLLISKLCFKASIFYIIHIFKIYLRIVKNFLHLNPKLNRYSIQIQF